MSPFPPSPQIPFAQNRPEYLTLAELEVIEAQFAHLGVSILAAGDEWLLTVPIPNAYGNPVQTTFRAHKAVTA